MKYRIMYNVKRMQKQVMATNPSSSWRLFSEYKPLAETVFNAMLEDYKKHNIKDTHNQTDRFKIVDLTGMFGESDARKCKVSEEYMLLEEISSDVDLIKVDTYTYKGSRYDIKSYSFNKEHNSIDLFLDYTEIIDLIDHESVKLFIDFQEKVYNFRDMLYDIVKELNARHDAIVKYNNSLKWWQFGKKEFFDIKSCSDLLKGDYLSHLLGRE